ncbi:H-2 class II histocompatibility antigen, A-F alpha chain-like [Neoarius graeffei]|uniref:H-2 class II histocompatibility antigen, A-F alpha chain-like n=1 Tax=Neoarius graeffei TaxID=443677 RepID=UPI00298BF5F7|nr:H-2 class II histocompatibility antigen, A-F alpha chain-like [Neoarius graeffei]
MKLCMILVLLPILRVNASFDVGPLFTTLSGCSDSGNESQFLVSLNQNEILYEDFEAQQQISRLPPFIGQLDLPDLYVTAVNNRDRCLLNIKRTRKLVGSPAESEEPPEVSIYPKHNIESGVENNFICFMKNFYPPHIKVNWMRNGESVTEGVYNSQLSMNTDGTFNSFSILTSSPTEGDEYSCMVEHEALDSPQTRTWDEPVVIQSVTPTVVFAVGIAVGILGLAIGMFFVIKASCSC